MKRTDRSRFLVVLLASSAVVVTGFMLDSLTESGSALATGDTDTDTDTCSDDFAAYIRSTDTVVESNQMLAQTFTVVHTDFVGRITQSVQRGSVESVDIQITELTNGVPDLDRVIYEARGVTSLASEGWINGEHEVASAESVPLEVGTQYALVVTPTTGSMIWQGRAEDAYPSGEALAFDGTGWSSIIGTSDLGFDVEDDTDSDCLISVEKTSWSHVKSLFR